MGEGRRRRNPRQNTAPPPAPQQWRSKSPTVRLIHDSFADNASKIKANLSKVKRGLESARYSALSSGKDARLKLWQYIKVDPHPLHQFLSNMLPSEVSCLFNVVECKHSCNNMGVGCAMQASMPKLPLVLQCFRAYELMKPAFRHCKRQSVQQRGVRKSQTWRSCLRS